MAVKVQVSLATQRKSKGMEATEAPLEIHWGEAGALVENTRGATWDNRRTFIKNLTRRTTIISDTMVWEKLRTWLNEEKEPAPERPLAKRPRQLTESGAAESGPVVEAAMSDEEPTRTDALAVPDEGQAVAVRRWLEGMLESQKQDLLLQMEQQQTATIAKIGLHAKKFHEDVMEGAVDKLIEDDPDEVEKRAVDKLIKEASEDEMKYLKEQAVEKLFEDYRDVSLPVAAFAPEFTLPQLRLVPSYTFWETICWRRFCWRRSSLLRQP